MLPIIKNRFMDNQIELFFPETQNCCLNPSQKPLRESYTPKNLSTGKFRILFPDEFLVNNKQFQPDPVDIYGHKDVVFFLQT